MSVFSKSFDRTLLFSCLSIVLLTFSVGSDAEIVINKPAELTENTVAPEMTSEINVTEGENTPSSNISMTLTKAFSDYKRAQYNKAYSQFAPYAESGNPQALLATGYFLFMGYGTETDFSGAKYYLEKAGKMGFARAYTLLGLLENKQRAQQTNQFALRHFKKAADMGDSVGANALANLYYHQGNIAEALSWNNRAISLGSHAATLNKQVFANNSNRSSQVISAPPVTATSEHIQKLKRESQEGNGDSSYELATRYHKGVGVPKNFGEAIRLYRVAAGQGNAQARKILPVILSKQNQSGTSLNSLWMQETSSMVATPPIILTPNSATSGETAVHATPRTVLVEDDPLENLLSLRPVSSTK
ncbi:tetratricopeptide repeat protein [Aggregatibacter kilianii]|uniref:tetratricopeptide repeat protein n=1 Tax=Aggregatibacter kilianii TaxID=2025884 RepID=UPI000D657F16|nr:tetratricopeptide repeat protein [Aggregatibacter kilianii]